MFVSITIFFFIFVQLVTLVAMLLILSFLVNLVGKPIKFFWNQISILK